MNFWLSLVCVLPALISPGYSFSCTSCLNENWDTCTGSSKDCPPESDCCSSTYTQSNIYGTTTRSLSRGCGYSVECAQSRKSMSNQLYTEEIYTSCCKKDECTPAAPIGKTVSYFTMKGCATSNLCSNYNGTTSSSITGETEMHISCNNATANHTSINITSKPGEHNTSTMKSATKKNNHNSSFSLRSNFYLILDLSLLLAKFFS
ncbi:uncharacterized protein RCH25_008104 [Pelodytes ibericus]